MIMLYKATTDWSKKSRDKEIKLFSMQKNMIK